MKLRKSSIVIWCLLASFLFLGIFFLIDFLQEPVSVEKYREVIDSETFIELSKGKTRYELNLIDTTHIVLFIHGGGILGYEVFRENIDALNKAGFSTLAYDQYGRGYSDKPKIVYNSTELGIQLKELIRALNLQDRYFSVVSLSFGSMIALNFIQEYSDHITSNVFISPSIFNASSTSGTLKVPVLNYSLMTLYWRPRYLEKRRKEFYHQNAYEEYVQLISHFSSFKGFKRVYLSSWNQIMSEGISKSELSAIEFETIKKSVYIFGEYDPFFGIAYRNGMEQKFGDLRIDIINSTGHMPNFEAPNQCNQILVEFLTESKS